MIVRLLSTVSLICIIGMVANFISEMANSDDQPPSVLVGTLSVTCIAVLYCAITFILYIDSLLPFLVSAGMDFLLLIALIIVAVTIGKPLSFLNCAKLSSSGGNTDAFITSVGKNASKVNYFVWAGANKSTCYEIKAVWGFAIALCVLFAFSSVTMVCLWKKQRDENAVAAKVVEEDA